MARRISSSSPTSAPRSSIALPPPARPARIGLAIRLPSIFRHSIAGPKSGGDPLPRNPRPGFAGGGEGVQSRSCRCRSREVTGPVCLGMPPRPRPVTLRPNVFVNVRRSHLQLGLSRPVPNGFVRRFIDLMRLLTAALRIGGLERRAPGSPSPAGCSPHSPTHRPRPSNGRRRSNSAAAPGGRSLIASQPTPGSHMTHPLSAQPSLVRSPLTIVNDQVQVPRIRDSTQQTLRTEL